MRMTKCCGAAAFLLLSAVVPNIAVAQKAPCVSAGMSSEQIESGHETVLQAVEVYNSQNSANERMELPVSSECFFSTKYMTTISFYPNGTYASCAATENCTGKYAGYIANIIMFEDWIQVNASVGLADNMLRICNKDGGVFEGSCLSR